MKHRYFKKISAFSRRGITELEYWKEQILRYGECHWLQKCVTQLLKAINDTIRKMQEIAVSTPRCDIESYYDASEWDKMKMIKAAEEDQANKVILTYPRKLRTFNARLEFVNMGVDDYSIYMQRVTEEEICELTAEHRVSSKILNEMDEILTKQLTDFGSGLQQSELHKIRTAIETTAIPETNSGLNRKRPIDCISFGDTQCMLQYD